MNTEKKNKNKRKNKKLKTKTLSHNFIASNFIPQRSVFVPTRINLSGWRLFWTLTLFVVGHVQSEGQTPGEWTWMRGSSGTNSAGNFGTMGVPHPNNEPPALYEACEWKDNNGNFWLFGGVQNSKEYAALWKYDVSTNMWTWMNGPSVPNTTGVPQVPVNGIYGTQGTPSPANHPGARAWGTATWVDASGNLWLFGGFGDGVSGGNASINDLWKYTISTNEWTWMKGPNVCLDPGSYGTIGVASPTNLPPARHETSCTWTDNAGNLWLYGGWNEQKNRYGDLWKYDISTNNWTWMHGANTLNAPAVYGTLGSAAPANTPGGRSAYCSWTDLAGNLWLFGGGNVAGNGQNNDLWKYDPTLPPYGQWTCVKGNNPPNYGSKCMSANSNIPPARIETRARVRDACGNFWNFAGGEEGLGGNAFNDLWHYNVATNQWTWVSGDNTQNQTAVHGTKGISAPGNKPAAKMGSVAWIDNNGYIWVFGGQSNTGAEYNDLFRFVPDCPLPTAITAGSNTTICPGQSATLTASGGTNYSWAPGGQSTSSLVVSPTISTTYTVTGTGVCGTNSNSTVTVTVSSLPPSISVSPNTTLCNGQSATLTATGGTSYVWSPGGQSIASIVVSPITPTSYTVTGSNMCGSGSASVTVTVIPAITATAGPNSTICAGQNATLTASGGNNYSWSNGQTTGSIILSPTVTTTYSVIVSNSNCSDTAYGTITVNSGLTVNAGNNITACTGTTITLSASGGSSYSWNNGQITSSILVSPTTSATYTVIATDAGGCTGIDSVTVSIIPSITANAGPDRTICAGNNVTLNASGGTGYSWLPSTGLSNPTIFNPISSPPNTITYTVLVTSGLCAPASDIVTVVVNPNPTALAWNDVTITYGSSTTLSASGGGTYNWSNGANSASITVSPPVTTVYCVYVSNLYNCKDTACVTVSVEPLDCGYVDDQLFVPDAFSPNADTKNDVLSVLYPTPSCIRKFLFIIYDRWGEKVFEAVNIHASWDGMYNGKLMNTAVFVYYLKVTFITGNEVVRTGNVSLIR